MRMKLKNNRILHKKILKIIIFAVIAAGLGTALCMGIKDRNKQGINENTTENTEQNKQTSEYETKTNNKPILPDELESVSISVIFCNNCDISFVYDFIDKYENIEVSMTEMEPEIFNETIKSGEIEADICFCDNITYKQLLDSEFIDDIGVQLKNGITAIALLEGKEKDMIVAIKTLIQSMDY